MSAKRILVVDDEPAATRLLRLGLERTGAYEVCEQHSAERVLSCARQFKPDLILLDIVMPDLDGGDVAGLIRKDPQLRGTPILFLTSLVSEDEVANTPLYTAGCRVLAKPIATRALIACIEQEFRTAATANAAN
ncbi:response regulator [bacterium]|nr:response regulator [bacterium]